MARAFTTPVVLPADPTASNQAANKSYVDAGDSGRVPTTRTVTAGTGLTGGGALSADIALSVAYGTTSTTACVGNDARLSNARTPTAHASSHATAGSDPLAPADIGAATASHTHPGYSETCPAVSAGGSWTVTHDFGTRGVLAMVARTASPYDYVDVRIERTTTNTVTVLPDVALSSGAFEIMVYKVA